MGAIITPSTILFLKRKAAALIFISKPPLGNLIFVNFCPPKQRFAIANNQVDKAKAQDNKLHKFLLLWFFSLCHGSWKRILLFAYIMRFCWNAGDHRQQGDDHRNKKCDMKGKSKRLALDNFGTQPLRRCILFAQRL